MALNNFFRINLPYVIRRTSAGEWFVFNREYLPLGWNDIAKKESLEGETPYAQVPIRTKYKGLTDTALEKLVGDQAAFRRDSENRIQTVFFYNDHTNPSSNPGNWDQYFKIIAALAKLERI